MLNFPEANRAYEHWLAGHLDLIPGDLRRKHSLMAKDSFSFFRATFFRWAQWWPELASDLATMPAVLAVGDLHVENFGLWRDADSRLAWGINDFDEACSAPYGNDLARLAASVHLATRRDSLACKWAAACDAIMEGYTAALKYGGRPFVLAENNSWLRIIAGERMRDHKKYWERLDGLTPVRSKVGASVLKLLTDALPAPNIAYKVVHRQAGLGSLGRHRYLALGEWQGGKVGREAKALAPSAWQWFDSSITPSPIRYSEILGAALRSRDPHLQQRENWIVRRLAPDCSRIELASLPEQQDELKLLYSMGWETANVHLGSESRIKAVRADMAKRKPKWLRRTAETMAAAMEADWEGWRAKQPS
jgi:hypothetical protein